MVGKNSLRAVAGIVCAAALYFPAFPIAGIGVHYGIDMSLSMENVTGEQAAFSDLKLDVSKFGTLPSGYTKTELTGMDLPIYINRINWERHWFNLGGKVYIDIIPFIDAIELSVNYGMWEYHGSIKYPTSITFNPGPATNADDINKIATVVYDSTDITLKGLGINSALFENTPYAKLQFDITARKYLLKVPPVVNILKIYGGAGISTMFATPLLSAAFIEKAIGKTLESQTDVTQLKSMVFGSNSEAMKKVGEQFMKELFTPHTGAHLDLGAMIKFPIVPFGIYIDGKYILPFGDMDDNVDGKLFKGNGFLLNSGILFGI